MTLASICSWWETKTGHTIPEISLDVNKKNDLTAILILE